MLVDRRRRKTNQIATGKVGMEGANSMGSCFKVLYDLGDNVLDKNIPSNFRKLAKFKGKSVAIYDNPVGALVLRILVMGIREQSFKDMGFDAQPKRTNGRSRASSLRGFM